MSSSMSKKQQHATPRSLKRPVSPTSDESATKVPPAAAVEEERTVEVPDITPDNYYTEAETTGFVEAMSHPPTAGEDAESKRVAEKYTQIMRDTYPNYAPRLVWRAYRTSIQQANGVVSTVDRVGYFSTAQEGGPPPQEIRARSFMGPVARGNRFNNMLSYGNFNTSKYPALTAAASPRVTVDQAFDFKNAHSTLPQCILEDQAAYTTDLYNFNTIDLLDHIESTRIANKKGQTYTAASMRADMANPKCLTMNTAIRGFDTAYIKAPFGNSCVVPKSWEKEKIDPAKVREQRINEATESWKIVRDAPRFFGLLAANGTPIPDANLGLLLTDAFNPKIQASKSVVYGFRYIPIMTLSGKVLSERARAAIMPEEWLYNVEFEINTNIDPENPSSLSLRPLFVRLIGRVIAANGSGQTLTPSSSGLDELRAFASATPYA